MIAWSIAQISLLGTLMALAAWGAESALRTARRPTRWPWLAALLLTLVLGGLSPLRMTTAADATLAEPVTTANVAAPAAAGPTGVFGTLAGLWQTVGALADDLVQRGWSAWHAGTPGHIGQWLLLAWMVTSVTLLVAFAAVHWRYQRRRAQWPLHSVSGTTVRVAQDTGPAVIGVTNTEIVVPAWLLERDALEQRLVLDHELEHVRLHDPLLLAVAQLAVVLLPWHPAVWWMASRLRLAVELDCDARVLARGATARDYGSLLIDLTDHRAGFGAALPAFSCRPSHLERRLVAMTPKRLKYPLVRAVSTGAVAALALLAACEAKLPTSEEVETMTAKSATESAARVALVDTAKVVYLIDGVPATKAQAEKLAAEQIASVNVTQQGMQSGGEVRIVTKAAAEAAAGVRDTSPTRIMLRRTDPSRMTVSVKGDSIMMRQRQSDTISMRADTIKVRQRTPFTGLVVVDGVITASDAMNRMSPDQIASVNVIKGPAATAKYSDPRAINGVIEIVTKAAKP